MPMTYWVKYSVGFVLENKLLNKEYYFKEGCYIQEWQNSADQPGMSIARVRVLRKTATRLHALRNTTERYVILSGEAEVTVDAKSWTVGVGDVVNIAPNQTQKIENRTNQDLVFLAVCTPRFVIENYYDLESQ